MTDMKQPLEGLAQASMNRRSVMKAAAWAAPVVAVAAAAPAFAASPVIDSPTAYVTGTLTATGTTTSARTATYSGGQVTFNSAGQPIDSGTLTLSFTNTKVTTWSMSTTDIIALYVAAGWVLVSNNLEASIVFSHAPISDGGVVSMPSVAWSAPGSAGKPNVAVRLSSDADDVSALGLELN